MTGHPGVPSSTLEGHKGHWNTVYLASQGPDTLLCCPSDSRDFPGLQTGSTALFVPMAPLGGHSGKKCLNGDVWPGDSTGF